jgi:hypothetical protein
MASELNVLLRNEVITIVGIGVVGGRFAVFHDLPLLCSLAGLLHSCLGPCVNLLLWRVLE